MAIVGRLQRNYGIRRRDTLFPFCFNQTVQPFRMDGAESPHGSVHAESPPCDELWLATLAVEPWADINRLHYYLRGVAWAEPKVDYLISLSDCQTVWAFLTSR